MKARALSSLTSLLLVLASCAQFESIDENQCGNKIIDPGEDCDIADNLGMPCFQPGEELECRFQCGIEGVASGCADGYACGSDGVCRSPSGFFTSTQLQADGALALDTGDFDGDGAPDIIAAWNESSVVHYLGEESDVESTEELAQGRFNFSLVVGDLTEDDSDDIAFIAGDGVAVLRGSDDRELAPTAYASLPIPEAQAAVVVPIEGVDGTLGDFSFYGDEALAVASFPATDNIMLTFMLLVAANSPSPTEGNYVVSNGFYRGTGDSAERTPLIVEDGALQLASIPTGHLAPAQECEQFVTAFKNGDIVLVHTPCEGVLGKPNGEILHEPGPGQLPAPPPLRPILIDLPSGFQVGRAFVVDATGDGTLDVLVTRDSTDAGGGAAVVVPGPFTFAAPDVEPAELPAEPYGALVLQSGEEVLEVVDLNLDGAVDFVTTFGVYVTRPEASACGFGMPRPIEGVPGTTHHCEVGSFGGMQGATDVSVAVADVNRNGLLDVAYALSYDRKLRLLSAMPDGTYVPYEISTVGYPSELVAGDFDGDTYTDIAFSDRACPSDTCFTTVDGGPMPEGGPETGETESEPDTLSVAFGRDGVGFEEPRVIGLFTDIDDLVAGRLVRPQNENDAIGSLPIPDGIDELGVLSNAPIDDQKLQLSFSFLFGSTERELQAPFRVFNEVEGSPTKPRFDLYIPESIAIGQFSDDGVPGGVHKDIAVLARGATESRLWLLESDGEAELSLTRSYPSDALAMPDGWSTTSDMVVADLDQDGIDEVLQVGPNGDGKGMIAIGYVAASDAGPSFRLTAVQVSEPFAAASDLPVIFIADGARTAQEKPVLRDIDGDGFVDLVATVTPVDASAGKVVVYFNKGSGSAGERFSDEAKVTISTSSTPIAVNALNLDADRAREIVVLGADGQAFWYDVAAGEDETFRSLGETMPLYEIFGFPRSLAVVELDGDGLEDLVVGYADWVDVLRNEPTIR